MNVKKWNRNNERDRMEKKTPMGKKSEKDRMMKIKWERATTNIPMRKNIQKNWIRKNEQETTTKKDGNKKKRNIVMRRNEWERTNVKEGRRKIKIYTDKRRINKQTNENELVNFWIPFVKPFDFCILIYDLFSDPFYFYQ